MTIPDLTEKKFGIYGIQGSGKTYFAQHYVVNRLFPGRTWVLTSLPYEWQDPSIKCFYTKVGSIEDVDAACAVAKKKAMQGKLKLLLIDEADRWFSTNADERAAPNFHELVLEHRHKSPHPGKTPGLAIGLLTRRPQDIAHHFVGSAYAQFVFALEDPYAIKMFDQFGNGMAGLIRSLKYGDHQCVVKVIGQQPYVTKPI